MSVFVHAQGIETVHAGGGVVKNGKMLSAQLLNDPSPKFYSKVSGTFKSINSKKKILLT